MNWKIRSRGNNLFSLKQNKIVLLSVGVMLQRMSPDMCQPITYLTEKTTFDLADLPDEKD